MEYIRWKVLWPWQCCQKVPWLQHLLGEWNIASLDHVCGQCLHCSPSNSCLLAKLPVRFDEVYLAYSIVCFTACISLMVMTIVAASHWWSRRPFFWGFIWKLERNHRTVKFFLHFSMCKVLLMEARTVWLHKGLRALFHTYGNYSVFYKNSQTAFIFG